jgi:hypothetical protein
MSESRPIAPSPSIGSPDGHCRLAWWSLAFALIYGGIMRSAWIEDMEWKKDERWSFEMSQEVGRTRPWPSVGMPTSLEFPNPGLSVWVFVPIGRIADTPTSMARAIVWLNVIGLIGFAGAVRAYLPPKEREPWVWGLALQAVSPFAIRMSRKIWPPSILTPLLLLLWICHRHRRRRRGAFAWGLVGALIGQVHLSGWFVAAGLVLGTMIAEYRGSLPRSRYWTYWLLGSALGLIGALPWARTLMGTHLPLPADSIGWMIARRVIAYTYSMAAGALGVFPYAFLGIGQETPDFLVGPIIDGRPAHLPELVAIYIGLALGVRILVRLIRSAVVPGLRWVLRRSARDDGARRDADAPASGEPADTVGATASTGFYLWSTLAIPGVLCLLTIDVYFYHYIFVFCPFLFVLVAASMLPWRRALLGLVIAQALMSYAFLGYIHENAGTRRGEYGPTYGRQMKR